MSLLCFVCVPVWQAGILAPVSLMQSDERNCWAGKSIKRLFVLDFDGGVKM